MNRLKHMTGSYALLTQVKVSGQVNVDDTSGPYADLE